MLQVSDLKGGVHIVHIVHNLPPCSLHFAKKFSGFVGHVDNLKTNCPHCPQVPRPSLLAIN
jgi:hypothetical protein